MKKIFVSCAAVCAAVLLFGSTADAKAVSRTITVSGGVAVVSMSDGTEQIKNLGELICFIEQMDNPRKEGSKRVSQGRKYLEKQKVDDKVAREEESKPEQSSEEIKREEPEIIVCAETFTDEMITVELPKIDEEPETVEEILTDIGTPIMTEAPLTTIDVTGDEENGYKVTVLTVWPDGNMASSLNKFTSGEEVEKYLQMLASGVY